MGFTERRSLRLSLLKSLPKKHNSCDLTLYLEIYGRICSIRKIKTRLQYITCPSAFLEYFTSFSSTPAQLRRPMTYARPDHLTDLPIVLVFSSTSRVLVRLTPTGNLAETPRCLPEFIFRDVELGPDKPAQQKSPRNFFIARVDVIGSGAFYSAAQRCHCFFFAPESGVKKLTYHKNHVRYTSATHYPPHTEHQSSSLEQQRHLVVLRHPEKCRWPKNPPSILLGNQHPRKSPSTPGWHLRRSSLQVRQHRGLTVAEASSPTSLQKLRPSQNQTPPTYLNT